MTPVLTFNRFISPRRLMRHGGWLDERTPDRLGLFQFVTDSRMREVIFTSHERARDVLRAGPGDFPIGLTIALPDIHVGEGGEQRAAEFRRDIADAYLERLTDDDYVGVQNYGRMVVGPEGIVRPGPGAVVTQSGEEFSPQGIKGAVKHAAQVAGIPVYVTENGIATAEDTQKFGIVGVDRATQTRTPKPSAHWMGEVARSNQVPG